MDESEQPFAPTSTSHDEILTERVIQEEYISLDAADETVPSFPHDSEMSDGNQDSAPLEAQNQTKCFSEVVPDAMQNLVDEVKPSPDVNSDTTFLGENISKGEDAPRQGYGGASPLSDPLEMSLNSKVEADDDTTPEFQNASDGRPSELAVESAVFNVLESSDSYSNGLFKLHTSQMKSIQVTEDSIIKVQEGEQIVQDNFPGNGNDGISGVSDDPNLKPSSSTCMSNVPSVRVIYNGLARESREKLIGVMKLWSEWHRDFVGNTEGYDQRFLESGDETYFPALQIGGDMRSMSFWMDKPSKNGQVELAVDSTPVMHSRERDVPLYDRASIGALVSEDTKSYMEGNLDYVEDRYRCFNCGSYSHSLKECPRPRDHAAIHNARRLHTGNRGLAIVQRTSSRYYQSSPFGKFDDLKPGVLGTETRRLLGIGELDPPPWLNRMRELGYPPGYLEDQEEVSSGITIFGADEDDAEGICTGEDGEIIEEQAVKESKKKMAVEFPGFNAPIPHDADTRTWESPSQDHSYWKNKDFPSQDHSYWKNKDWDGPSGTTRDSQHKRSRRHSPHRPPLHRPSSDNMRSPTGSYDELPPLRVHYRQNLWPHQSPPMPNQRLVYDEDYSDESYEARRQAWATAQNALESLNRSRHSPYRRH